MSSTGTTTLGRTTLGAAWVQAIVEHDADALRDLIATHVDFKGLTPRRTWEAANPDEVVDVVLGHWFEESDRIDSATVVEGEVVDVERVGYRFEITNPDGAFVVEQQAYFQATEGRVDYLRVVCSGFRARD